MYAKPQFCKSLFVKDLNMQLHRIRLRVARRAVGEFIKKWNYHTTRMLCDAYYHLTLIADNGCIRGFV